MEGSSLREFNGNECQIVLHLDIKLGTAVGGKMSVKVLLKFYYKYTTGGALKLPTRRVVLPVADYIFKRMSLPSRPKKPRNRRKIQSLENVVCYKEGRSFRAPPVTHVNGIEHFLLSSISGNDFVKSVGLILNAGFCNILKDACGKPGRISAITAGTFVVGEVAGTGILALPLALSQSGKKLSIISLSFFTYE